MNTQEHSSFNLSTSSPVPKLVTTAIRLEDINQVVRDGWIGPHDQISSIIQQQTACEAIGERAADISAILPMEESDTSLDLVEWEDTLNDIWPNTSNQKSKFLENSHRLLIEDNYNTTKTKLTKELEIVHAKFVLLEEAYFKIPRRCEESQFHEKRNPQEAVLHTRYEKIRAKKNYLERKLHLEEERYKKYCDYFYYQAIVLESRSKNTREELSYGLMQREIENYKNQITVIENKITSLENRHVESTRQATPSLAKRLLRKICFPVCMLASWVLKKMKTGFLLNWREHSIMRSIEKASREYSTIQGSHNAAKLEKFNAKRVGLEIDLALTKLERLDLIAPPIKERTWIGQDG